MVENLLLEHDGKMAFHPGSYISDLIDDLDITQREFAKRLNTSPKTISLLVKGNYKVSPQIATSLSQFSGTSIDLWLNLQAKYDSLQEEIKYDTIIEEQFKILDGIQYNKLARMGFVPKTRDKKDKVKQLCRFLKVASLDVLKQRELAISFRTTEIANDKHVINTNIWIQMVANTLDNKPVITFDKEKLLHSLHELRRLTDKNPNEFIPIIERILEECGVNFVLMPSIPNAQPKGMVMWRDGRIILGMSNKGSFSDMFWFTLFHEIGHVILHPNKDFVDLNHESTEKKEREADEFSKEILLPIDKFEEFVAKSHFSLSAVEEFANEMNIEKSIVIGRLQNEGYIGYQMLTKHKRRYKWDVN